MTILDVASRRAGIPYRIEPPPDGVNNLDCSLYVLVTFRDAGQPFPPGVRTAEQIRQACEPVDFGEVAPGDLLFFEHTYEPNEAPGPDGHTASHIGISLGAGSRRMWDAHAPGGVQLTNIGTGYWQGHLLSAGRPSVQAQPAPLPSGGRMRVVGTSGSGVNVREQPDASSRRVGGLDEGATVEAGDHAWRRVKAGVLEGWVAAEYLEEAPGEPDVPQEPSDGAWAYWSPEAIADACNVPMANVEQHWPLIHAALAERGIDDRLVLAAALATVAIESASTFAPVREAFWLSEEWRRNNLRYYPYYGRGHLQLTWRENYAAYGNQLGVDLVSDPDLALDPEVSARVLALYFDQRGVADAARVRDWGEVRRRVQGAYAGLDRLVAIVEALGA